MANDETGQLRLVGGPDVRGFGGKVPAVAPGDFDVSGSIFLRFITTTLS
jgi:hypothetical protein